MITIGATQGGEGQMAKLSYKIEIAKKLKPGEGQTIRLVGKHHYKIGEKLYHYTGACKLGENILLGTSTVSEVIQKTFEVAMSVGREQTLYVSGVGNGLEMLDFAHQVGFECIGELSNYIRNRFFYDSKVSKYGYVLDKPKELVVIKWLNLMTNSVTKK